MTLALVCLAMMMVLILLCLAMLNDSLGKSRRMMSRMTGQMMSAQSSHQQEMSRLVQSVVSVTTESTTKLSLAQLNWTELMAMGRPSEDPPNLNEKLPNGSDSERQLIPGLETFEGLPDNIREALQREMDEELGVQPVLSRRPPIDFANPLPEEPIDPYPQMTPEEWMTE